MVNTDVHRAIFPESILSGDLKGSSEFAMTAGGIYTGVGRQGQITGKGAHGIMIDDVFKGRKEARSETLRASIHEWFEQEVYTRLEMDLDSGVDGFIGLVNTRWHEMDLAGYCLAEHPEDGWIEVNLPAILEESDVAAGLSEWEWRKAGEPLWPEKFPIEKLERIKAAMTPEGINRYEGGYQEYVESTGREAPGIGS